MTDIPIAYPGRFAPGVAINYADELGEAVQVSHSSPLPVTFAGTTGGSSGSAPAPLAGATAAALTAGPFAPLAGRPVVITLAGTWTGTVRLLRSVDGGATRLPLTLGGVPWAVYSGNVCEPAWEENESGVWLYVQLAPASGSIHYRLAQ